jgi:hypothetical protein
MLDRAIALAALATAIGGSAALAQTADPLADGFRAPPESARPRVWWHWLNGNITQEGITKDLEWMKRVGIGGVQNFDAALGTPQVVEKRLAYMTPEWKQAFTHAVRTADRLGLEFAIAASPGWSETGGPWVPPQDGMKKLVWSITDVTGGMRLKVPLAPPPAVTGPFQDIGYTDPLAGPDAAHRSAAPAFFRDITVFAYPLPTSEAAHLTGMTSENQAIDPAPLSDGKMSTGVPMPKGTATAPGQVTLRFAKPRRVQGATVYIANALPQFGDPEYLPVIEAEVGGRWTLVADAPLTNVPTTVAFPPVEARAIRVTLGPNTLPKRPGLGDAAPGAAQFSIFPPAPPSSTVTLGEFSVQTAPTIHRFEAKAAFATALDYHAIAARSDQPGIDPARVIDLSGKLRADGTLDWVLPKGRWRIVRLGYSLTGKTNHPATPEATGLEVDKYDGEAVRRYLDTYLGNYRSAAGEGMLGGKGVGALLTDSIESGDSNWTPKMVPAFKDLRGYDPTPWLPALTGAVIGSTARTDAFLYDYRRTLADLLAREHYGTVADVAHAVGLKVYGEALEDMRPLLGDDMAMRAKADVPMAAMWTYGKDGPRPTLIGDIRGAASVAHIYGQNIVAAESLTSAFSPWAFAPADLKPVIDLEFALGVNRPVIHTSVHQPLDIKQPGLSLAIFGQYFNRHESWAEMAKPWVDYIARTSFLLQQGRNVADVAYFYGEDAPITALNAYAPLAEVPAGYGWDYVNAAALNDAISVEGGVLVAKGGARYRVLYLGGSSRQMTLPTLRRIAALAEAGATIVGRAPDATPSLADDRAAFATLVKRLWSGAAETKVGAGRVIASDSAAEGLRSAGVAPDFVVPGEAERELMFVHRKVTDGDIYWVNNRKNRADTVEARFRVAGTTPVLWHADTGRMEAVPHRIEGNETIVSLQLDLHDAVFVVFRAGAPATQGGPGPEQVLATLANPWRIAFQPGRGAPAALTLQTLEPLEKNNDVGVRYFSGVATYTSSFDVPRGVTPGRPLWLDLGKVGDVAEVRVNGLTVGSAWHAPYRLEVSKAVKRGRNTIEVTVANLWVNRLIGDAQPNARKVTFTTLPTYRPDAPLRPSGLIGPVRLIAGE